MGIVFLICYASHPPPFRKYQQVCVLSHANIIFAWLSRRAYELIMASSSAIAQVWEVEPCKSSAKINERLCPPHMGGGGGIVSSCCCTFLSSSSSTLNYENNHHSSIMKLTTPCPPPLPPTAVLSSSSCLLPMSCSSKLFSATSTDNFAQSSPRLSFSAAAAAAAAVRISDSSNEQTKIAKCYSQTIFQRFAKLFSQAPFASKKECMFSSSCVAAAASCDSSIAAISAVSSAVSSSHVSSCATFVANDIPSSSSSFSSSSFSSVVRAAAAAAAVSDSSSSSASSVSLPISTSTKIIASSCSPRVGTPHYQSQTFQAAAQGSLLPSSPSSVSSVFSKSFFSRATVLNINKDWNTINQQDTLYLPNRSVERLAGFSEHEFYTPQSQSPSSSSLIQTKDQRFCKYPRILHISSILNTKNHAVPNFSANRVIIRRQMTPEYLKRQGCRTVKREVRNCSVAASEEGMKRLQCTEADVDCTASSSYSTPQTEWSSRSSSSSSSSGTGNGNLIGGKRCDITETAAVAVAASKPNKKYTEVVGAEIEEKGSHKVETELIESSVETISKDVVDVETNDNHDRRRMIPCNVGVSGEGFSTLFTVTSCSSSSSSSSSSFSSFSAFLISGHNDEFRVVDDGWITSTTTTTPESSKENSELSSEQQIHESSFMYYEKGGEEENHQTSLSVRLRERADDVASSASTILASPTTVAPPHLQLSSNGAKISEASSSSREECGQNEVQRPISTSNRTSFSSSMATTTTAASSSSFCKVEAAGTLVVDYRPCKRLKKICCIEDVDNNNATTTMSVNNRTTGPTATGEARGSSSQMSNGVYRTKKELLQMVSREMPTTVLDFDDEIEERSTLSSLSLRTYRPQHKKVNNSDDGCAISGSRLEFRDVPFLKSNTFSLKQEPVSSLANLSNCSNSEIEVDRKKVSSKKLYARMDIASRQHQRGTEMLPSLPCPVRKSPNRHDSESSKNSNMSSTTRCMKGADVYMKRGGISAFSSTVTKPNICKVSLPMFASSGCAIQKSGRILYENVSLLSSNKNKDSRQSILPSLIAFDQEGAQSLSCVVSTTCSASSRSSSASRSSSCISRSSSRCASPLCTENLSPCSPALQPLPPAPSVAGNRSMNETDRSIQTKSHITTGHEQNFCSSASTSKASGFYYHQNYSCTSDAPHHSYRQSSSHHDDDLSPSPVPFSFPQSRKHGSAHGRYESVKVKMEETKFSLLPDGREIQGTKSENNHIQRKGAIVDGCRRLKPERSKHMTQDLQPFEGFYIHLDNYNKRWVASGPLPQQCKRFHKGFSIEKYGYHGAKKAAEKYRNSAIRVLHLKLNNLRLQYQLREGNGVVGRGGSTAGDCGESEQQQQQQRNNSKHIEAVNTTSINGIKSIDEGEVGDHHMGQPSQPVKKRRRLKLMGRLIETKKCPMYSCDNNFSVSPSAVRKTSAASASDVLGEFGKRTDSSSGGSSKSISKEKLNESGGGDVEAVIAAMPPGVLDFSSPCQGVVWDAVGFRWVTHIQREGRRYRRTFSANSHGFEKAKRLAVESLEGFIAILEGEK